MKSKKRTAKNHCKTYGEPRWGEGLAFLGYRNVWFPSSWGHRISRPYTPEPEIEALSTHSNSLISSLVHWCQLVRTRRQETTSCSVPNLLGQVCSIRNCHFLAVICQNFFLDISGLFFASFVFHCKNMKCGSFSSTENKLQFRIAL